MRVALLSTILFFCGTLSFLRGFLNLTPDLTRTSDAEVPARSSPVATKDAPHQKNLERDGAPFDNLVFVLIDALRSDNVFPVDGKRSPMPFVQKCAEGGKAIGFISHGQPPTVTLPRIKALTSGSVPGFADVILNFFAAESKGANIVANLKRAGKKLVFYGDDTWLKLFPHHFARFDGTTSFFVNDYTTVDENVTRHLDAELSTRDWDVLILHYLGLDHIGHTAGPHSPLVAPKLEEMDAVIRRLAEGVWRLDASSNRSTLIVVTGDHGMSNLGSHGGSSQEEIQSPLLFIAQEWQRDAALRPATMAPLRHVQQIDVAPTLAYLTGVPVPEGSKGVAIPEIVAASSSASYSAGALLDNLDHLCPSSDCGSDAAALRLRLESLVHRESAGADHDVVVSERLLDNVVATLQKIQASYLGASSQYLLLPMALGGALQIVALWGLISTPSSAVLVGGRRESNELILIFVIIVVIVASALLFVLTSPSWSRFIWSQTSLLEGVGVVIAVVALIYVYDLKLTSFVAIRANKEKAPSSTVSSNLASSALAAAASSLSSSISSSLTRLDAVFAAICLLVHAATLASSSFVEEEHFTWYFLVNSSLLFFFFLHFVPALFGDSSSLPAAAAADDASFLPDSSLNSSNYEISYSWEDRAGAAGLNNGHNGGVGRRVFRRGTGNVAFLNASSSDDSGCDHSFGSSSVLTGNGSVPKSSSMGTRFRFPDGGVVKNLVSLLLLLRLIKSWNPTGQKWNDLATISTVVNQPEHEHLLVALVIASLGYATFIAWTKESPPVRLLLALGGIGVFSFRFSSSPSVSALISTPIDPLSSSRFVLLLILVLALLSFRYGRRSIAASLCLTTLLLARLHNVPLVAFHLLAKKTASRLISVSKINFHPLFLAFFLYSCSQFAFFSQGTCNSLASVDVSASTVGLTSHHPVPSGLLLIFATYSLPLLWLTALFEVESKESRVEVAVEQDDKEMLSQAEKVRRGESTLIQAASTAYADPTTFLTSLHVLKKDMHHLLKMQEAGGQNGVAKIAAKPKKPSSAAVLRIVELLLVCRALPLTFFSFVVFIQRYHLFIWSVFAPKLLFEAMNFVVIASFSVVAVIFCRD